MIENDNNEEIKYSDCYIAFLDLLGFKDMINKKTCDEILAIFDKIKLQPHDVYIRKENGFEKIIHSVITKNIKMKIMSDSICFYVDAAIQNAFSTLLTMCMLFQIKMASLPEPVLMRGGIVRGNIYASGDVTFGPGLTSAYLLEEKSAKFPRIIFTHDTLLKALNETIEDYRMVILGCIFRDEDGFYALNYFNLAGKKEAKGSKVQALYDYACKQINSPINPSVKEKYIYLEKKLKMVIDA